MLRWGLCAMSRAEMNQVNCECKPAVSPAWLSDPNCTSDLSTSFADIVRDELLQTASFEHTSNKSLALIQVNSASAATSSDPLFTSGSNQKTSFSSLYDI